MKNLSVLFALQSCITFHNPPNISRKKLIKIKNIRNNEHFIAYNNHFFYGFSKDVSQNETKMRIVHTHLPTVWEQKGRYRLTLLSAILQQGGHKSCN